MIQPTKIIGTGLIGAGVGLGSRSISTCRALKADHPMDCESEIESISDSSVHSSVDEPEAKLKEVDNKLSSSNQVSRELRADLRNTISTLNRYNVARDKSGSLLENHDEYNQLNKKQEKEINDEYIASRNRGGGMFTQKLNFGDRLNALFLRRGLSSKFKSEYAAQEGVDRSVEEIEASKAVQGLNSDLYKIRKNFDILMNKREKLSSIIKNKDKSENKSSLVNDYADVSTEMPSYIDPEDLYLLEDAGQRMLEV